MTGQRWIGSPAIAALIAVAIVSLSSSCGQSTPSATRSTPSAALSPTPAASPPPGGPVPAQLLGNWLLPRAAVIAIAHVTPNVPLTLTLEATTYHLRGIFPPTDYTVSGSVVVNNSEIDFFNEDLCGYQLPDGVGRYKWTLTGGVLHFTLLNQDLCGRTDYLGNQNYSRTS